MFCFYPTRIKWSHGIALLSAICKQRGIKTDLCILSNVDEFLSILSTYKGKYVAFSCTTRECYRESIPFIKAAKKANFTTLLGGVWCGLNSPVCEEVDYCCRGDGESLPDFILNGNTSLFDSRQRFANLDDLPIPDCELFKDIPFERGFGFLDGKKVLPYISSRGCLGKCIFCQVQHQGHGVRIRSKISEDLTTLRDLESPDVFWIGDATTPYHDIKWRESWKDFRYPFACYICANIKPYLLDWLIDRGMVACGFGVESGDETFRNKILKKDLTDYQLFRTVDKLAKAGLDYASFYMAEIPGETFEMRAKTNKQISIIGGTPILWKYEDLKNGN